MPTPLLRGNFVNLNFEFLLVLNHGDVTWDNPKGENSGKQGDFLNIVLGKNKKNCRYL
jgi:hypothetical protein